MTLPSPLTRESAYAYIDANADAFALGALSRDEAADVAAALAAFPDLLPLVDSAIAAVQALPFAMPLIDAPGLATKLDLFAKIDGHRPAAPSPQSTLGSRIADAWSSPALAEPLPSTPAPVRPWHSIVASAMLAPLAIALVVVSLWAWNLNSQLDEMESSSDGNGALTDGSVIEMYTMENMASTNARASIGSMPNDTSAVLLAWDLNPTEDHEVWCEEKNGKKWKVGSLSVGENGSAAQTIQLPKPIDGYARIYVSGSMDDEEGSPELILNIPDNRDEGEFENGTPAIGN